MKLPVARSCLLCLALSVLTPAAVQAEAVFPAPDWQVDKPEAQQMSPEGLEKVGAWLKDHGSKTGLVVRHGRIVGEWYFGDAAPQSKYLVYSTTKSFASTAAGLAIAAGKLNLDSKLGDFFPDANPPEKREITVRQLLSMSTGAHNDNEILGRRDLFAYVLKELPMDAAPGEKWDYNNSGLSLLSPVVHKATGQNIVQILDEGIFRKIGVERDDWTWEERDGMPIPYSGLHITARALARFGLLFLNKGQWRGSKIVSSTWVTEATRASQALNPGYGYLWWNNSTGAWPDVPADAFAAMGRFGNHMLIVPSLDLIVIRQIGEDPEPSRPIKMGELFALASSAVTDTTSSP
jgi:CubicO group peptidase (beta-lactamase class C family)